MNTRETIAAIAMTASHKKAQAIALANCQHYINSRDVVATGRDNGWSTQAIYAMPDGGEIRLDGRGWRATLRNGTEIVK